jgi:hypothetical protein
MNVALRPEASSDLVSAAAYFNDISDRLRDLKLPNIPGCPQINAGATRLVLRGSNRLVMQSVTKGIVSGETNLAPLELFKNTGKTPKSSVPVLSVPKPWFPKGFSHFWPVALAFLHVHARACLQVLPK